MTTYRLVSSEIGPSTVSKDEPGATERCGLGKLQGYGSGLICDSNGRPAWQAASQAEPELKPQVLPLSQTTQHLCRQERMQHLALITRLLWLGLCLATRGNLPSIPLKACLRALVQASAEEEYLETFLCMNYPNI